MSSYPFTIVQTFKVERRIRVLVEADSREEAEEKIADGEVDTPNFNNPLWTSDWNLQNEEYEDAV